MMTKKQHHYVEEEQEEKEEGNINDIKVEGEKEED